MHNMEHRWGKRVRLRHRIQLTCPGRANAGGIFLEASLSGGFVQTNMQARLLSGVEIEIEIGGETRRVSASVVRREFAGLALEWSEFAPEAVIALIGECAEPATRRYLEEPARGHAQ